jgi:lipoate-protein ligase A
MNKKFQSEYFHIDETVLERIQSGIDYAYDIYEPNQTIVVLGRSSKLEDDVYVENCKDDGVLIFRRAGGGGTVVLSRGTIIISAAGKSNLEYHLREHMNAVNRIILGTLQKYGIERLSIRGISDIALDEHKILGSSLYRRKDILLYQGSLLVCPDLSLIERYLKHPKKEPDYRRGRIHRDFLTSLHKRGYAVSIIDLIELLKKEFMKRSPWPPSLNLL